jgi:hypothetical protein
MLGTGKLDSFRYWPMFCLFYIHEGVSNRDAPDIRPDNPFFFDIRSSDNRLPCRISG